MTANATEDRVTIALSDLRIGVTLPAPIYDGRRSDLLLLAQGTVLTERAVEQLRSRGVQSVSVSCACARAVCGQTDESETEAESGYESRVHTLFPYCADTSAKITDRRRDLIRDIDEFYHSVRAEGEFANALAERIVRDIVSGMADRWDLCLRQSCRPCDDPGISEHTLRLAEIAMTVGMSMGYDNDDVKELGLGCVLHAIGSTVKSAQLIGEARYLSQAELIDVKKVPARTFEMLCRQSGIPVGARLTAYQIHERWDGSGYPRGKSGSQIHELARIAAIANAFVALTSSRPHRPAFRPYDAVKILLKETADQMFDPAVTRGLLSTVSIYPLGTMVALADRRPAIVAYPNGDEFTRPIVELVDMMNPHGNGDLLDLAADPELEIAEVVTRAFMDSEEVEQSSSHEAIGLAK